MRMGNESSGSGQQSKAAKRARSRKERQSLHRSASSRRLPKIVFYKLSLLNILFAKFSNDGGHHEGRVR